MPPPAACRTRAAPVRASALGAGGPTTCPATDAPTAEAPASALRGLMASRRSMPFPSARTGSGCAPPIVARTADTRGRLRQPRRVWQLHSEPEPEPAVGPSQLGVRLEDSFGTNGYVGGVWKTLEGRPGHGCGRRRTIPIVTGYTSGTNVRNASTTSGRHHLAHFRISAITSSWGIAAR